MNGGNAMLMAVRVIRALVGVFALIMLKATLKPGYEYFAGDESMLITFAWRSLAGVAAIITFFHLRTHINRAYVAGGTPVAPLRSVLSL